MPYSNGGGGTLTLPSPTHVHHVDVTSAVRSLRRSLSRSPSKFRLITKSPSPSSKSPLSPSSLSSPKRASINSIIASVTPGNTPHTPSPLAVPFPPSVKLALRSSSRTKPAATRSSSRTRASPKSPIKRALNRKIETSYTALSLPAECSSEQENNVNTSTTESAIVEQNTAKIPMNLETNYLVNHPLSRLGGDCSNDTSSNLQTSSPLKRSDAIMNIDQASLGSPVAKRRSLHGSANFGHDFNVFDHGPSASEIHEDLNPEYELSSASFMTDNQSFSSLPKRSSSLRKSTLQQRHGEKKSLGRRHAVQLLAAQQAANVAANNCSPPVLTPSYTKNRPRLSLDQFMPPAPRESPFSNKGSLPNASSHLVNQICHQPHPLSRTMTNTSSCSNSVDESSNHLSNLDERRPKLDFSKSLPAGALRPFKLSTQNNEDDSFATPQNYKLVKPLPAAFASTGLISKVNRNPEEPLTHRGCSKSNVPDTPCKKHFNGFATHPAAMPGSAIAKARHIRHSFGTPSTPFNVHGNPGTSTYGLGNGVFGSAFVGQDISRRSSFLSLDGEESISPESKCGVQSMADLELPPTPTKQALVLEQDYGSPSTNRNVSTSIGHGLIGRLSKGKSTSYKRTDLMDCLSSQMNQESIAPPDPSGLRISNHRKSKITSTAHISEIPPATPTAGRDYHFKVKGSRTLSTTPNSTFTQSEVDDSLTSKFEKVEMIGTGQFSYVFRVTEKDSSQDSKPSSLPMPDRVFAVKKSRQPFQGIKDRERKLQEVNVLKALGHSDHIVHLLDTWEDKNHLYIQTEFCEEGSMDLFLSQVGRKGRLDDFRIWKILLELGLGLKHIHDFGFIHLDLKPANVLITFEGVLKIADFGIATAWPAQPGIEGEGDREYIGPEILEGIYDKPADVFSLGLMMLEIAGNVQLPDNGPTWQRLRSGDVSDVPSLTWSSDNHTRRDATGTPIDDNELALGSLGSDDDIETEFGSPSISGRRRNYGRSCRSLSHDPSNLFGSMRRGELHKAPNFMTDMYHQNSLDQLVRWMITPNPNHRPVVHELLQSEGVLWVETRRRAGATVYEGNWGPSDEVLSDDTEMRDI
ncbi:Mitosis inhibitor protein kinase wee1 [Erysiphe necator]|uniref:Protein kinase domain-containing protein n=1 Tax=Uncinula necator TaxID=52586 RepID=A0A0B1NY40_UNCNE|nr:Mitosis inhibitor protein kinase wee1 [Erysiphe necator]KHJ30873.1 putative protein kinase [Erysiphe necator]